MSVYIQYRMGTIMPFGDLVEKSELTELDKNMISDGWAKVWLNPTWVEWLMGFPLEWTKLNDLGMQWFRSKQK